MVFARLSDDRRSAQKREKSRIEALRSKSIDAMCARCSRRTISVLDDRARAQTDVVDDELGGRDANDQAVAPLERGVDLVAGGDGVRAERAGRRVRVELPDRAGEQVQELLDRREVVGTRNGARSRTDGPGGSCLRFVIDGPQRDRHPALFCSDPKSRQEARRHNFATMCPRGGIDRRGVQPRATTITSRMTALKRTEADPMASLIEAIEIKRKM